MSGAHLEGGSKTYQNDVPTVFPLQKSHPEVIKTPRRILVGHKEEEIQEDTRCGGGSSVLISPNLDTITRAHQYLNHCVFSD